MPSAGRADSAEHQLLRLAGIVKRYGYERRTHLPMAAKRLPRPRRGPIQFGKLMVDISTGQVVGACGCGGGRGGGCAGAYRRHKRGFCSRRQAFGQATQRHSSRCGKRALEEIRVRWEGVQRLNLNRPVSYCCHDKLPHRAARTGLPGRSGRPGRTHATNRNIADRGSGRLASPRPPGEGGSSSA